MAYIRGRSAGRGRVDGEGGGEVGGEGGWAVRDGLNLSLGHRQQYCVFSS